MGDHDVTLAECVGLLSSESRERKFMGMVLVTKLVHGLDPESLRAPSPRLRDSADSSPPCSAPPPW